MQKEVLRFVHPDYEVIVRTQDISYSWKRFKGRINHTRITNPELVEPDKYCRYTSKDSCKLCLYNPIAECKTDDKVLLLSSLKAKSGTIFGRLSLKRANIKCVCSFMV